MSRLIVLGGHGKVARLLAPLLVEQGHAVTSVIRSQEQVPEVEREGVVAAVADIGAMDAPELAEMLRGHDAVIWSAGAGGGSPENTYRIDRDAAIYSMQSAQTANVRRYVMVSWAGSSIDHDVEPGNDFYPYAQAKAIADAVLRDTGLDWTIVAPGALTLDPATGRVGDASTTGSVPRADVAAVIARCIADHSTVGRTIRFTSGEVPIADYLRNA